LPFTPLSYAGVARRTVRRAYWYGAAAAAPYYSDPTVPAALLSLSPSVLRFWSRDARTPLSF